MHPRCFSNSLLPVCRSPASRGPVAMEGDDRNSVPKNEETSMRKGFPQYRSWSGVILTQQDKIMKRSNGVGMSAGSRDCRSHAPYDRLYLKDERFRGSRSVSANPLAPRRSRACTLHGGPRLRRSSCPRSGPGGERSRNSGAFPRG
jgi:hypothetical protein